MAGENQYEEEKPDSLFHHEDRLNKMRTESAALEKDRLESQEISQYGGIIHEGETRDQLLDRIRKMREEPPKEPEPSGYVTDAIRKRIEEEQQAGREAVARAEADAERNREARLKAQEEGRIKDAVMVPVHHPNPSQDEQYPAVAATLGKARK